MKIIHLNTIKKQKVSTPLFTGKVGRQSPMAVIKNTNLAIDYIHFPKGIRNKFHSHSNEQVLIVTKGSGIIATKEKKYKIKVEDIVWIAAGEIHWHGASINSNFTHIAITKALTKITQTEK